MILDHGARMMIHPGDNPVGGPPARKAMRWRWPLAAVVLVVVAFTGLTAWLFVWPATATPERPTLWWSSPADVASGCARRRD